MSMDDTLHDVNGLIAEGKIGKIKEPRTQGISSRNVDL